jgi:hypothetical protein
VFIYEVIDLKSEMPEEMLYFDNVEDARKEAKLVNGELWRLKVAKMSPKKLAVALLMREGWIDSKTMI